MHGSYGISNCRAVIIFFRQYGRNVTKSIPQVKVLWRPYGLMSCGTGKDSYNEGKCCLLCVRGASDV